MRQGSEGSSVVGQIRESLAALRELAIVAAIALLVAWPSLVKSTLEKAGVRSVAGLEFDWEQLAEANEEAQVAERTVSAVTVELESVSKQLSSLSTQSQPDVNELRALSSTVARLKNQTREADATLSRSIATHDRIIKKAPVNAKGRAPGLENKIRASHSPNPQSVSR